MRGALPSTKRKSKGRYVEDVFKKISPVYDLLELNIGETKEAREGERMTTSGKKAKRKGEGTPQIEYTKRWRKWSVKENGMDELLELVNRTTNTKLEIKITVRELQKTLRRMRMRNRHELSHSESDQTKTEMKAVGV